MKFRFRIEAVNVEQLAGYQITHVALSIICPAAEIWHPNVGRITLQFQGNHFTHFVNLAQRDFSEPFEIPLPEPMERK